MVSSARTREIAHLLVQVRDWAVRRPDIEAVALAGSWAHGNARMDSDLDLVVLSLEPERYLGDSAWSRELGNPILLDARSWGPLTELRFILPTGLEIDFGVAPVSWAAIDPVDDGTWQVVQDGISVLHDPHHHLARLIRACQSDPE
jgi:predicted nucleotidyltransferase